MVGGMLILAMEVTPIQTAVTDSLAGISSILTELMTEGGAGLYLVGLLVVGGVVGIVSGLLKRGRR